jgi:uncharacterized protein YlzI (FlbEa/FlbD family)
MIEFINTAGKRVAINPHNVTYIYAINKDKETQIHCIRGAVVVNEDYIIVFNKLKNYLD